MNESQLSREYICEDSCGVTQDAIQPKSYQRQKPLNFYQALTCHYLEKFVDPWAKKYVGPALSGDIEAAFNLSIAASNEKRGLLVVEFWKARAPRPAFRALLNSVWDHDHHEVIDAAETRRRLRAIFRYGQFTIPDLPERVRVWRGTYGFSSKKAVRGYSWTLDRDIACWFAMRFATRNSAPLVLTAEIRRDAISYYSDERKEQEVILFDAPTAAIDGTPEEWTERYEYIAAKRKAEMKDHLAAMSKTGGPVLV